MIANELSVKTNLGFDRTDVKVHASKIVATILTEVTPLIDLIKVIKYFEESVSSLEYLSSTHIRSLRYIFILDGDITVTYIQIYFFDIMTN